MKNIPLGKGLYALVDDADHEWLSGHKWGIRGGGYPGRTAYEYRSFKNYRIYHVLMHREIMGAQRGQLVDHINGDTLDNRRANLRLCTHAQNHWNSGKPRISTSSRYKGVNFDRQTEKWRAKIKVNGKHLHLGRFASELDAAYAYDAAAMKHHGEFARMNFTVL